MSWSVSTGKPVKKEEIDAAIDALTIAYGVEPPALDQLRSAKLAAKMIAHNIPGPYLMVNLGGHANGVGWQKKEGWSNDTINVGVVQITEDMLHYYQPKEAK